MDRTNLEQILGAAPGVTKADDGYVVADEHRATIYLGRGGQATAIADLVRIQCLDAHVEAEAKDRTLHFVLYEPILGLALKRPHKDMQRTGF